MENLSGICGYVASTLLLFTFVAKDMRLLRTVSIFSNRGCSTRTAAERLPSVPILHLVLLPRNVVRRWEVIRVDKLVDNFRARTNTGALFSRAAPSSK